METQVPNEYQKLDSKVKLVQMESGDYCGCWRANIDGFNFYLSYPFKLIHYVASDELGNDFPNLAGHKGCLAYSSENGIKNGLQIARNKGALESILQILQDIGVPAKSLGDVELTHHKRQKEEKL